MTNHAKPEVEISIKIPASAIKELQDLFFRFGILPDDEITLREGAVNVLNGCPVIEVWKNNKLLSTVNDIF